VPRHSPPPDSFEPWEIALIDAVVWDFLKTRKPSPFLQFEDLVQEVLQHWWTQRGRYRAERGASPRTYLRKLANRKLIDLEREQNAAKRGGGQRPLSLDAPVGDDDASTLGSLLEAGQQPERLQAALNRARAKLSSRQRRIVVALDVTASKSEAARLADVSRDTLYAELASIRDVFRDEGLDEFLH